MKNNYALFVGLVIFGFAAEAIFHLNAYILILVLVAVFTILLKQIEKNIEINSKRMQDELSYEVKTTTKDAYLKYKQLVTTVSSIPFPMLLLDQYGTITMHNSNCEELGGIFEEEQTYTYLKNEMLPSVQEFIKDSFIYEKEVKRMLDVAGITYQGWGIPITTKNKFSGCLILFQNMSQALEGEKMQKRFIADASHELKTPIAVIKGMVEILNRDDFNDPEIQKDFLSRIEQEVTRLEGIIKDMLQLSKMSIDHPVLQRKKLHMNALINESIHSVEHTFMKKGINIKTDFVSEDEVFCDLDKMMTVITNLLTNACKYSDKGTVSIKTYLQDRYYVIEIKDEGCGLNKQQKEKIFDRFYRVDDDRSRKNGGTGLGLAIVKSIVDAHSGKISVESEEGKGSTFSIYLKN